jgi:hypothetical protein
MGAVSRMIPQPDAALFLVCAVALLGSAAAGVADHVAEGCLKNHMKSMLWWCGGSDGGLGRRNHRADSSQATFLTLVSRGLADGDRVS